MIVFSMNGYVQRVQFTNGNVNEYVYGADGRKLRATYRTAIPGIVVPTGDRHTLTDSELDEEITVRYVDGFEVVDNWDCANYFFGNGYLDCDTRQHYNFHFFAKDHLGSTRAVFHSDGTLENVYDYQTYGNDMCDWDNRLEAMTHKYNGKELETRNGLNLYDYGARLYDPLTGLFTSIDPLCEKYYHVSPYAYCAGNPVKYVDPDGRDWVEGKNGDITWRKEINAENYSSFLSQDEIYRGLSYTRDKIWMDKNVKGNSESGHMTENYLPSGVMKYKNNTPWVDTAVEEMKKDISESGSNPEILKYFEYTQLKGTDFAKTDKTPWCAAFVNYCMEVSGIYGTNYATAYSFSQWGQSFSKAEPQFGSIAIMNYSHVGIVVGRNDDGRIILLGGNQKDAVNLSPNPTRNVIKYVFPEKHTPSTLALPSFKIRARSLNISLSR